MLIKHATHTLTDQGLTFFTHWLEKLKQAQKTIDGFIDIFAAIDTDDPYKRHVFMFFQNQAGFDNWLKFPIHETLLQELSHYMQKPWIASTYQVMD